MSTPNLYGFNQDGTVAAPGVSSDLAIDSAVVQPTDMLGAPEFPTEKTLEELRVRDQLIGVIVRPGEQIEPSAHECRCPSIAEIVKAVKAINPSLSETACQLYAEALIEERSDLTRWNLPCRLESDLPYAVGAHPNTSPTRSASILRDDYFAQ